MNQHLLLAGLLMAGRTPAKGTDVPDVEIVEEGARLRWPPAKLLALLTPAGKELRTSPARR